MTGCIWVTLLYPLAEDEGITVYGPFADAGFYEALLERASRVAHSVCLDMYGTHDLHSAAYRHDPQGSTYRARVV